MAITAGRCTPVRDMILVTPITDNGTCVLYSSLYGARRHRGGSLLSEAHVIDGLTNIEAYQYSLLTRAFELAALLQSMAYSRIPCFFFFFVPCDSMIYPKV